MTIIKINEIENPLKIKQKPIKENHDVNIPDIKDQNISMRNGMIYTLCGSGGSGKTSLLLNMFKNKLQYRNKFHNIYYFCPISSFLSVVKHPFENHDKVYHELTVDALEYIYNELVAKKEKEEEVRNKIKEKKKGIKKGGILDVENDDETDEENDIEYSCCIIDDFADTLKDISIQRQLNKMLIKARHIRCSFIFTLQSFYLFPKILRKQITYTTIFQCKNIAEWYSITSELLNYNKDDALKLYNYVFNEAYNHMDLNTVDNRLYKNFNLLEIEQ
jgi:hypothetical protein